MQTHERPVIKVGVARLSGHFTIYKGKCVNGKRDRSTEKKVAEFDNIITDLGKDHVGNRGDYVDFCHVGSGTATEVVGDTALGSFIAGVAKSNDVAETFKTVQGSSPYYSTQRVKYEFGEGVAEGNISEIGISTQITTGSLFSRARVKDGGGTPTTITVLSDEYLDVTYDLRMYPDHVSSDGTGSITITGVGSVSYTIRAAKVTTLDNMDGVSEQAGINTVSTNRGSSYSSDVTLGAVTSNPTATDSENDPLVDSSVGSYGDSNYYVDLTFEWGLSKGNLSDSGGAGIQGIMVHTTFGSYQITFGTLLAKDNTKIFEFDLRIAWERATIP